MKPLQARLDHQLLMMYLTRIAGIETILQCVVQLYGYKMYLTRITGIETQNFNTFNRIYWMYLTRIAGIETTSSDTYDSKYF